MSSISFLLPLLLFIISIIDQVSSIACYKCSSVNRSNPSCEDPFQGDIADTTPILHTPCMTNIRGRKGLFPATHCLKLIAYSGEPNSTQYVYRTCSRDEGNDDGITRASHCGYIKLDWINPHRRFRGCLHVCDRDGCNQMNSIYSSSIWKIIFCLSFVFYIKIFLRV